MLRSILIVLLGGALALSPILPLAGQCLGDDGFLAAGCCTPTVPLLPPFPAITLPSAGCCFFGCVPTNQFPVTIALGAPVQVVCDVFIVPISIVGPPIAIPGGFLVAKYMRTWNELSATGVAPRQVWRFLVNADLSYVLTSTVGVPCPVPPCGVPPVNLPVHFIGSLDYALSCNTIAGWSAAINLTHLCGTFSHAGFSARPLAGPPAHGPYTYSFAGPAPFVFGIAPVPSGPLVAEATRGTVMNFAANPFLWICQGEAPLLQGNLATQFENCLCEQLPPPTLPQWKHQVLNATFGCNGIPVTVMPIPAGNILPTGLVAMNVGTYAVGPGVFPNNESVSLYLGLVQYQDPCSLLPVLSVDILTGVGTVGGDPAVVFGGATGGIVNEFVDLENILRVDLANPNPQPGFGSLFVSTRVFNLNSL